MISVHVDPRIELLTAVQLFTSWRKHGIWRKGYPYMRDMIRFFERYRAHRAIRLFEKLLKIGFNYDAPVGLMIHLSNPPELKIIVPLSEYLIKRAHGVQLLQEFIEALRNFSIKSNFIKFWEEHLSFYRIIEEMALSKLRLKSVVRSLEEYFGVRQHGYHVILAPLFYGNYGYRIKVNSLFDIYAILGPREIREDLPVFGAALFHEFAHSFVNPLTEKFSNQFKNGDILFKPIANRMMALAYGNWETIVNEHVIRAIDIRVNARGEAEGILNTEERRGFIYIRPIYNLLEKYEKQRDRYQTFRDFYPNIVELFNAISDVLEALEKLKPKGLFKGPINSVFEYKEYLDKLLIVEPSRIRDNTLKKKVSEYLDIIQNFLRERFKIEVPKVSDIEALKMDLKERVLLIYGTPNSNMVLEKLMKEFPFTVTKNGIKLGEKFYAGEDLRFITVYINPMNKTLPILIYTATRDEGILGINSLFHGPTDYILYRGRDRVVEGYYKKKDGVWKF